MKTAVNEELDNFIDEDLGEDLDDPMVHAALNAALRAEEAGIEALIDEEIYEDGETDEENLEEEKLVDDEKETDDVALSLGEGLWEIRCKLDREMEALKLLLDSMGNDEHPVIKSAMFRPDRPGYIYVELRAGIRRDVAMALAARACLGTLIRTRSMRFTPCPDTTALLDMDECSWLPGTWAWIRGPKLYRGDIGFIFLRKNKRTRERTKWVAVVPRIDIYQTKATPSKRPAAQTLNVNDLILQFKMELEFGRDFGFWGQTFNYSGYLLLWLEEADLYPPKPPPAPLLEEFDLFLRLPVLGQNRWGEHRLTAWQQRSTAQDRVKIIMGQYEGAVGVLLSRTNEEAEVYLPAQDEAVVVGVRNLQIQLQVGDHVRVVNGEYKGQTGYITTMDGEWVDVTEPQQAIEIHILALDVEFYTAPTVIQFQSHKFEVGDEICAIAGPHLSKVGTVGAIHDGWLAVTVADTEQVDIFYRDARHTTSPKTNRMVETMKKAHIDMYSQYKERDKLAMALPPPVSALSAEPAAVIPERRPITCLFPEVNILQKPVWRPRYKAPSAASSSLEQRPIRADHPSLNLPAPTWLLSHDFVPHRIKLIEITCEGPILEYYMPTEDGLQVHIRDCNTTRTTPVDNIRHLLPEKAQELVVPIVGEYRGKLMKVKEYGLDECSLTEFGAKRITKKGYRYPRCQTIELAITAPPKK
ncbi:hypothetical protein D9619_010543 [Psilocybe cf. subviscida]|uniref:KOW domain-containing protein n=1 Tax=Psilocybe cf. subviscida TaxID=2480587 RepID=A0A8H5ERY6_9AGAR|nr:hypothetical protein D9619_010543 [Psilocybe cf. subviscida]